MKYFIELFTPTQAWFGLNKEQRAAYLTNVNEGSKHLMDQGVVIVSMSENDQNTLHRAEFNFFVIWTIPTDELANAVQDLMANSDWFNYFDQVNLKGGSVDISEKLINI